MVSRQKTSVLTVRIPIYQIFILCQALGLCMISRNRHNNPMR